VMAVLISRVLISPLSPVMLIPAGLCIWAEGHTNDSAFNVNGCTYHYVAI